jgi:hypothetical protein
MTLNDLMVEQQWHALEHLDPALVRFADELRDARRHVVRERIAAMLVRLGMWFDRDAGERVAESKRPAPHQEVQHGIW